MTDRPTPARLTRPHSPALDAILGEPFPVLDHGFVRVIDYMGDDAAIAQAARVSYGRHEAERGAGADRKLIRYLMRERHTSPFEMCELKLHVKAPIFVARQWMRHRMASVNEVSGRYADPIGEFYLPAAVDLAVQSTDNKQGRGAALSAEDAERVLGVLEGSALGAIGDYEGLTEDYGLAREIARMGLSLNFYTEFYWKIDLHNLLHFLSLRMDGHAQLEIRDYADRIALIVADWVPMTWGAFADYRLRAATLSAGQLAAVRRLMRGKPTTADDVGLSPREWAELESMLKGPEQAPR